MKARLPLFFIIVVMLVPACSSTGTANLTGDWTISSSVGGQIPITVHCTLVQQGMTLSGTCTPEMENPESSDISGSTDGSTATWGYSVVFNGNPGTVEFRADMLSAGAMSGILSLSGTEAPFTAIRN